MAGVVAHHVLTENVEPIQNKFVATLLHQKMSIDLGKPTLSNQRTLKLKFKAQKIRFWVFFFYEMPAGINTDSRLFQCRQAVNKTDKSGLKKFCPQGHCLLGGADPHVLCSAVWELWPEDDEQSSDRWVSWHRRTTAHSPNWHAKGSMENCTVMKKDSRNQSSNLRVTQKNAYTNLKW